MEGFNPAWIISIISLVVSFIFALIAAVGSNKKASIEDKVAMSKLAQSIDSIMNNVTEIKATMEAIKEENVEHQLMQAKTTTEHRQKIDDLTRRVNFLEKHLDL